MIVILQVWISSMGLLITLHLASALAIDGRISLGTWDKTALVLFCLLGPLGLCVEILLLKQVFADIRQQRDIRRRVSSRRRKRLLRAVQHILPGRLTAGMRA